MSYYEVPLTPYAFSSIAYSDELGMYVATTTFSEKIIYSYDGINWTEGTLPAGLLPSQVKYGRNFDGSPVFLCTVGFFDYHFKGIYRSIDGINWTLVYTGAARTLVYCNGPWLMFEGSTNVFISNDGGLTWNSYYPIPSIDPIGFYTDGVYIESINVINMVYYGPYGIQEGIFYSQDLGVTWNGVPGTSGLKFRNIIWTGDRVVTPQLQVAAIWTSTDGIAFTPSSIPVQLLNITQTLNTKWLGISEVSSDIYTFQDESLVDTEPLPYSTDLVCVGSKYSVGYVTTTSTTTPHPPATWDIQIATNTPNETFSIEFSNSNPNITVDWGDSNIETFTTTGVKQHTYVAYGIYIIKLSGSFDAVGGKIRIGNSAGTDGSKIKVVLPMSYIPNLTYAENMLRNLTNLYDELPEDLFRWNPQITYFNSTFYGSNLNYIPTNLFKYNVNAIEFDRTFRDCKVFYILPEDLFKYNTAVTFMVQTFMGTEINVIPSGLFSTNTLLQSTTSLFANCIYLNTIEADVFKYNTQVTDFNSTFLGCTSLTSLPNDLFRYNTQAADFGDVFTNTPISSTDYSNLLIQLNTYNNNNTVSLGANLSCYNTSAATSRNNLVTTKGWIITDAGSCDLTSFGFRINDPETTYINWNTLANGFSFNNIYTNATFGKTSTIDILNAGYLELTNVVLAGGAPNMGYFSHFPGSIYSFIPGLSSTHLVQTSLGSFDVRFNDNVLQTRTISQLTGSIKWYSTTTTTPAPTTSTTSTTP